MHSFMMFEYVYEMLAGGAKGQRILEIKQNELSYELLRKRSQISLNTDNTI